MKLNTLLSFKIFPTIFLKLIFQAQIIQSTVRSCDTEILSAFGIKSFCESYDELVISCSATPLPTILAYIRCKRGYYNIRNITEQIIFCGPDGKWSEDPMECIPICTENPGTIQITSVEKLRFPTAYAEIVFSVPIEGKYTVFPAIILDEKWLVVKTPLPYFLYNVNSTVRIYKQNRIIEYSAHYSVHYNRNGYFTFYVHDYMSFDESTKPICRGSYDKLFEHNLINFISRFVSVPLKFNKCLIPINTETIDTTCVDFTRGNPVVVECTKNYEMVVTRCKIGYENKNLNMDDSQVLSLCDRGRWEFFGNYNDCEMVCGEIDEDYKSPFSPLIYKGEKLDVITAPWHVAIFANLTGFFQQICGGSIIHSNIVLSVAHCFYDEAYDKMYSVDNFIIGAGKVYRKYDIVEKNQHFANVKEMYTPSNFQASPLQNDIAILILDHHLKYTSHIRPVCIQWKSYHNYYVESDIEGRIVGWGATSPFDTSSSELLVANFTTVSNEECRNAVNPNYRSVITGDKFCAKSEMDSAACRGDSGGGFVTKAGNGRYILLGLISSGINAGKHCSDEFRTLFTNIQWYQDVIKTAIFDGMYIDSIQRRRGRDG